MIKKYNLRTLKYSIEKYSRLSMIKNRAKVKLNPRQWTLVNYYLKKKDHWTNDIDVCQDLFALYPFKEDANFNNTNARRTLTEDKFAIRNSFEIPYLLISSNKGSKFANAEEWVEYFGKIKAEIDAKRSVLIFLEKKSKTHNQIKMLKNETKVQRVYID